MSKLKLSLILAACAIAVLAVSPTPAAADEYCEARLTNCRTGLLAYINREMIGLDVGMEEMTDPLIADAVIARFKARVPVRMIVEPRRNATEPRNGPILAKLKSAGIPMRYRKVGDTFHWKMMIFAGQDVVEFSAAQFTQEYLVPAQPGVDFTQDPIFYSTNTSFVNSFERKFDDAWVDTTKFANYGNSATVGAHVSVLYGGSGAELRARARISAIARSRSTTRRRPAST